MTVEIHGWTIALDDHPPVPATLTVQPPEVEYIRSYSAVRPDPEWLFEDSHGHLHVWTETGRDRRGRGLPSLVESERHVECDGSCGGVCEGEGYHITVYYCADCGDEVEPGFVPDYQARTTGIPIETGPQEARATVGQWPLGSGSFTGLDTHAAVMRSPDGRQITGKAVIAREEWGGLAGEIRLEIVLHGLSADLVSCRRGE